MQYKYSLQAIHAATLDRAWSDMEQGALPLLSALTAATQQDSFQRKSPGESLVDDLAELAWSHPPVSGSVMFIQGQFGYDLTPVMDESTKSDFPEHMIGGWTPVAQPRPTYSNVQRGHLMLDGNLHFGLIYRLPNYHSSILIHQSISVIDKPVAIAATTLPSIALLTFFWVCILFGISIYLIVARFHDQMDHERDHSSNHILRQVQNLIRTRDAIIFGLAKLAESRDPETGHHLERISVYATMLSTELRRHPKFRNVVTPSFVSLIGISSALHDIGKVGVRDSILLKPGKLSPSEQTQMREHPTIGGNCLRDIEQRLGGSSFLQMAIEITYNHHENWDGKGYPNGISKWEIPLAARIVALVDMYDALSTVRVYKSAMPHEECIALIRKEVGKKLDPELVEIWMTIESRFRTISQRYASGQQEVSSPSLMTIDEHAVAEDALGELELVNTGKS